jgi:hypothetical protein
MPRRPGLSLLVLPFVIATAAGGAPAARRPRGDDACREFRGRVVTLSVSATEQQGTITVIGPPLAGFRVASLRGLVTGGAPGGGVLVNHSVVFTHPRRPAARLFTEGDVVTLTATGDPCVVDVQEVVHLAGGSGVFADVDPVASSGEARGTLNVCTLENRFELLMRLCRAPTP